LKDQSAADVAPKFDERQIVESDDIVCETSAVDSDSGDVCGQRNIDNSKRLHGVDVTPSDRGDVPGVDKEKKIDKIRNSVDDKPIDVDSDAVNASDSSSSVSDEDTPPTVVQRKGTDGGGGGSISPDDVDFRDEDESSC
jgi:hypothetical protein